MRDLFLLAKLFAALGACVLVATILVATASAGHGASAHPPNGVYTCGWIATHPAAAAEARVTCDASSFHSAMTPPIAGPVAAILASPDKIDSQGCWDVPDYPTRIGPGVYAWSAWEYANDWGFFAYWGPPIDYTWYIQKSGPVTVLYSRVTISDHEDPWHEYTLGTYNTYRLGFQNHSSPSQSWLHCHSVV